MKPRHLPTYVTTLVSRRIPHSRDEMDDDRNFHHPADKAKAGEASRSLAKKLADLKKQFRKASATSPSVAAPPINPYEVRVSPITSDRSLSFPFRMHSRIIPYPIQPRASSVSTTPLTIYGIFDASKNVDLIRYSIWGMI